jgi:molybdenum cofactor cytidylyltransferase
LLAAVILAAGGSSRMGQPKQLLKFRGTSLLRRAIDTALAVPADQVIVVLGHAAERLMLECEATSATVVLNDQWQEGVSTSLRGGLAAVASEARGVFIYPADMPMVTPEALRELAHRQQVSGRPAAMTEAGGVRGVPVFVTRSLFPALMIQEGDIGGAQYLRAHPEAVEAVHFNDPDLVRDVDRPEDYARLLELDPDAELA